MKNAVRWIAVGVLGAFGLLMGGCKSVPELTEANAVALIQAHYDQMPTKSAEVVVDKLGLSEGFNAKYWERSKLYPNQFWADFKLTQDGKKVIRLADGSDVLQWRPENPDDPRYSVVVLTVAANHLQARDLQEIQDAVLPGAAPEKSVAFKEAVSLAGVPDPLVGIAHNPGNQLSVSRVADFSLINGAWTLQSIK